MLFAENDLLSVQEPTAKKIILVATSNEREAWKIIQAINQETPYLALLASSGFVVLKASKLIKPHLFLVAYRLPDMNALHLYDRLQAMREFRDIPFVLLSQEVLAVERERPGIVWIKKLFDLEDLLATIETLVASSS